MKHREALEATLISSAGVQRLTRSAPNPLSRVSLLPREPLSSWPVVVDWRRGAFHLVVSEHFASPVTLDTQGVCGEVPLAPGARFTVGQTPVTFECSARRWPVDVEREQALLGRDDDAAWGIYGDELLQREDPLGPWLARAATTDLPHALELRPLVASKQISVVADARGLWREVTFHHELAKGELREGVVVAVLAHPIAWFVRRVTVALSPVSRGFRAAFLREAEQVAKWVGCFAGPHLVSVVLSRYPARSALPSAREGVTVGRE